MSYLRSFHFKVTFWIILTCLALYSLRFIISPLIQLPYPFIEKSDLRWTADIRGISPGKYFVSVGRAEGICHLYLDSYLLDSNQSEIPGIRNHLLMGGSFEVYNNSSYRPNSISLVCFKQVKQGFSTKLFYPPVLAKFYPGLILQAIRAICDLILGPVCSLALLVSICFSSPSQKRDLNIGPSFYIFSFMAFVYSLSAAKFFTLVWEYNGASAHVPIRILFSLAFISIGIEYSKKVKIFIYLHLVCLLLFLPVVRFFPGSLISFYNVIYPLFPISTGYIAYKLFKAPTISRFPLILSAMGTAWTVLQIRDMFQLWADSGPYLFSSFIPVITGSLTYLKYRESKLMEKKAEKLRSDLKIQERIALFSRQLAHDIRSPLALLEVLLEHKLIPENIQEVLNLSKSRLEGLANSLLNQSRLIDQSNSKIKNSEFLPSTETIVISELGRSLEKIIEEKGHLHKETRIKLVMSDEFRTSKVVCQPNEFERVVSNLIDNAIEATGDILVFGTTDRDLVLISVEDSGKGIHPDVLEKLGNSIFTVGKQAGNGLGLFHAKKTIEYWNGELMIQSTPEVGTTVTISLPRLVRV